MSLNGWLRIGQREWTVQLIRNIQLDYRCSEVVTQELILNMIGQNTNGHKPTAFPYIMSPPLQVYILLQ